MPSSSSVWFYLGDLQKRQQAADTRETVLSGLKLTGETLGQGVAEFLGNRQEMTAVVLGLSAAALGIYSAKMGTGVIGRYVEVCRVTFSFSLSCFLLGVFER